MEIFQAKNHADIFFAVTQFPRQDNSDKNQTVFAIGGFYSQTLELIWTEDINDDWTNEDQQQ